MRPRTPKDLLTAAKTSAFLVTDLTNVRYLTELPLSFAVVLVTTRQMKLFTDDRYLENARRKVRTGVLVCDISRLKGALQRLQQCGFESETVTVSQLRSWKRKYPNTKFVRTEGVLQEFRRQKDSSEIRAFRVAQKITKKMLARVPVALRSCPTERELAWMLRSWAQELGAEELSFDPVVAYGSHSSSPHHHPTNKRLIKGQIVQIDVGARYRGYCADQSAVFFTGKKTKQQQKVLDAVSEAKKKSIEAIKVGVTTAELDQIARTVLASHGFEKYFTHALGHGVGLDIHEGVTLSSKSEGETLLKNEIITIEPGVYIPGKFGIRLEEEIIVA